jgi:hypothetical protein
MGTLLFVCISAFLILFVVNNDVAVIAASPLALIMAALTLVANFYLLRSLVRDWWTKRE